MTVHGEKVADLNMLAVQLKSLSNSGQSRKDKNKLRNKPNSNFRDKAGPLLDNKSFKTYQNSNTFCHQSSSQLEEDARLCTKQNTSLTSLASHKQWATEI